MRRLKKAIRSRPARQGHPGQPVGIGNLAPVGDLVLTHDSAREVHPPHLVLGVPEAQASERDREFGLPALLRDSALDVPDGVPVIIASVSAVLRRLTIPVAPLGVGGKNEAVAIIVKGIQNHGKDVGLSRLKVPPKIVDPDPVRPF